MNVNIDNLDHVLMTIDGFESLSNGDLTSPESVYTKTVLKLNGVDFKGREGSEGFMSSVKSGAVKIYEMIKNFIKAIRDFFKGMFGKKVDSGVSNATKSVEKVAEELTTQIPKLELSESTKEKVSEINDRLADKISAIKKSAENTSTSSDVTAKIKKFNQQLELQNDQRKTKVADRIERVVTETWEGSYKILFTEMMVCEKDVFLKTVKNLDQVASDYGMGAMCVSSELKEIKELYDRFDIKPNKGNFNHVIGGLKDAKTAVGILNAINIRATDSIIVLNDLLEVIMRVVDENEKHNVTNKLVNKDLRIIMGVEKSMTSMKSHFAKVVMDIESQIKKIEKVVLKKEDNPQSERIRQDCIDALGHLPE